MTMPRPSLVTSSGPSPVRGFIAAMLSPLNSRVAWVARTPPRSVSRHARSARGSPMSCRPMIFPDGHPSPKPGRPDVTASRLCLSQTVTISGHAGPFGALRPLRRPPAPARRTSTGRRAGPAARAAGHRGAGGAHRRLPDGAPGLAHPVRLAGRSRLSADPKATRRLDEAAARIYRTADRPGTAGST